MRRYICTATSTSDKISNAQKQVNIIKDRLQAPDLSDDERWVLREDLAYWEEELSEGWSEDEAEWDYARNAQEFNPDGSLALYGASTMQDDLSIVPDGTIQKGLSWDVNGHDFTVTKIIRKGWECEVTETWISEDTGKEVSKTSRWKIDSDYAGTQLMYPVSNPSYTLYATSADNYPYDMNIHGPSIDDEDEYDEDEYDDFGREDWRDMYEYYTPSATRHDYSPSNPWDAPGMSIHDFI